MAKKTFIISIIVFLLAGAGLVFLKFFPEKSIEVVNENSDDKQTLEKKGWQEDENKNEKIVKIIEGDLRGAFFDKEKDSFIYYNNKNFLISDLDGESRNSISASPFTDVQKIIWSEDGSKAIVKDQEDFFLVNLEKNKTEKIKEGIDEAVFNFTGDKLIYKHYQSSTKKRSINVSDLSGQDWEELLDTEYKKISFKSHPSKNVFLYFIFPQALEDSKLNLYDTGEKKEKVIFSGKTGADYLWSPKGDKILVSFTLDSDKSKLSLGVMNSEGGQFQGLNFPSSVKKCVWANDNDTVYCGMMNGFPSEAILPDDWQEGKYFSADTFWKIDTTTGEKERIIDLADLNEEVDGFNLFLDNDEKYLFLINKKDGDLYRIVL